MNIYSWFCPVKIILHKRASNTISMHVVLHFCNIQYIFEPVTTTVAHLSDMNSSRLALFCTAKVSDGKILLFWDQLLFVLQSLNFCKDFFVLVKSTNLAWKKLNWQRFFLFCRLPEKAKNKANRSCLYQKDDSTNLKKKQDLQKNCFFRVLFFLPKCPEEKRVKGSEDLYYVQEKKRLPLVFVFTGKWQNKKRCCQFNFFYSTPKLLILPEKEQNVIVFHSLTKRKKDFHQFIESKKQQWPETSDNVWSDLLSVEKREVFQFLVSNKWRFNREEKEKKGERFEGQKMLISSGESGRKKLLNILSDFVMVKLYR